MSRLVMGLDGGGTKTLLALADREGRLALLERASGIGPIENPRWRETLAGLLARLGPHREEIAFGVFALPSYGEMAELSAAQDAALAGLAGFPHGLGNDVQIAFEGAFAGGAGVLLLAGTGSMAWAGDAQGRQIRVGGWGHGFGDEGSGFWIGREALGCMSRIIDGRLPDAAFAAPLAARLRLPGERQADALMTWFHGAANVRAAVAGLAGAVDDLAEHGNATAGELLQRAAAWLAEHVETAWRRLPSLPPGRWSIAGGVGQSRIVCECLARRLHAAPLPLELPPVGGALWHAAKQAGWPADATWIRQLARSLADRTTRETSS